MHLALDQFRKKGNYAINKIRLNEITIQIPLCNELGWARVRRHNKAKSVCMFMLPYGSTRNHTPDFRALTDKRLMHQVNQTQHGRTQELTNVASNAMRAMIISSILWPEAYWEFAK
jgi:hypothetical protein